MQKEIKVGSDLTITHCAPVLVTSHTPTGSLSCRVLKSVTVLYLHGRSFLCCIVVRSVSV